MKFEDLIADPYCSVMVSGEQSKRLEKILRNIKPETYNKLKHLRDTYHTEQYKKRLNQLYKEKINEKLENEQYESP